MSRNKYPEETVAKILDVSLRLFLEKGYEKTTIQDIVDNLEGLTKGAIYHHFKSKEEILDAALDRADAPAFRRYHEIRDDASMTGLEKLQAMFETSAGSSQMDLAPKMAIDPDPVKNARLLGVMYRSIFEEVVPRYIEPIIRQGMEDGSIQTTQPREMAEVLVLLANLWVAPMFQRLTAEQLAARLSYSQTLIRAMGADLSFDNVSGRMEEFRRAREEAAGGKGSDLDTPAAAGAEGAAPAGSAADEAASAPASGGSLAGGGAAADGGAPADRDVRAK